jgi:hypothetical protein
VERPDGLGVGSIQHPAAVASDVDQSNISQDTQVLGDGGLLQAQARHNVPDRALLQSETVQDLSPTGLGHRVEPIRCGSCARHARNITFPYGNMSSESFLLVLILARTVYILGNEPIQKLPPKTAEGLRRPRHSDVIGSLTVTR